jgi:RNA polymerase sigma factor (sigma-70 family)
LDSDVPHRTEKTYLPLLQQAQAYLQSQLGRHAPDSVLTEAWEQFYRVYNDLIQRFAVAQGVRGTDVDDCVQEVWREVATRLADFQHPGNRPGLRAWLYTVVRSKAMDLLRQAARRPATSLDRQMEAGDEPCGGHSDPQELYERQWEEAMLQTMLGELRAQVSELNYRVLQMRSVEQRDVAEVAAALDLTREQVRYRHHRMLQKLRARVAVYTGEHFGADRQEAGAP